MLPRYCIGLKIAEPVDPVGSLPLNERAEVSGVEVWNMQNNLSKDNGSFYLSLGGSVRVICPYLGEASAVAGTFE